MERMSACSNNSCAVTEVAPLRAADLISSRSWNRTLQPSALSASARRFPIRPKPRMPKVISFNCRGAVSSLRTCSHRVASTGEERKTRGRMASNTSASTYSTTACVLASGVCTTRMPRALHAARSMWSRPTPARAITFNCGSCANSCASTRVAVRIASPSARRAAAIKTAFPGAACITSHSLASHCEGSLARGSVTMTMGFI